MIVATTCSSFENTLRPDFNLVQNIPNHISSFNTAMLAHLPKSILRNVKVPDKGPARASGRYFGVRFELVLALMQSVLAVSC